MSDKQLDLESLFMAALDVDVAQRDAWLERACEDDSDALLQVQSLLVAHEESGSFLETPPVASAVETQTAQDTASQAIGKLPRDFLAPCAHDGLLGDLGAYCVTEPIGRGGMGVVLRAHDGKLNRTVAIKVLAPELASQPTARQRFLREARAAAAVSHDHVVKIHAVDEVQSTPFLVMEFVEGQSLQERLDNSGPLDAEEVLRLGEHIAAGLGASHQKGLVHRDIKPANILLDGQTGSVKITDFGLARSVDDAAITQTGQISGTPQFMSPEQANGQAVDHRSDLFSLGSVLYAACTGQPPFFHESTLTVLRHVAEKPPRAIRDFNPTIPPKLAKIIDKLMAKKPERRFQSAAEVSAALSRVAAKQATGESGLTNATHKSVSSFTSALAIVSLLVFLMGFIVTEALGLTHLRGFIASVLRIDTDEGQFVVEVEDPEVKVLVDGKQLVITGAGLKEVRLKLGKHLLEGHKDGELIYRKIIEIRRNERPLVTVSARPPGAEQETNEDPPRPLPAGKSPLAPSWEHLVSDEWEWTKPARLPAPINISRAEAVAGGVSLWHEGAPRFSADERILVFYSDRPGGPGGPRWGAGGDLWICERGSRDQPWPQPISIEEVNSDAFDGMPWISGDGLTLLFSSNRLGEFDNEDIWQTSRESRGKPWAAPTRLEAQVNTPFKESSPFLSEDGLTLMFTSDRPGGVGETDLWMCTRKSVLDEWSKPTNLGGNVNSNRMEADPFLTRDGLTLLFASKRRLRSWHDIWMCTRRSVRDPWSPAKMLDTTVNGGHHDAAPFLSPDGRRLYFHSPGRRTGDWDYDILVSERVKKNSPVK